MDVGFGERLFTFKYCINIRCNRWHFLKAFKKKSVDGAVGVRVACDSKTFLKNLDSWFMKCPCVEDLLTYKKKNSCSDFIGSLFGMPAAKRYNGSLIVLLPTDYSFIA
jgi:hypothetical protein